MANLKPPVGLRVRGRRFWLATVEEYLLTGSELVLLEQACRSMDVLDALRIVLAREGVTTEGSRGQTVAHPAVAQSRAERIVLARLLGQLALPDADGGTLMSPRSASAQNAASRQWRDRQSAAAAKRGGRGSTS